MSRFAEIRDRLWSGSPAVADSTTTIRSWSGDVAQVAQLPPGIAEAFGISISADSVTRRQAMAIPAVRRGRQVITGPISAAPLVATRRRAGNAPQRVELPLLAQLATNVTNAWVIAWTVDALIFYGTAWWRVVERGVGNYPTKIEWVQNYRVSIAPGGVVLIDSKPVPNANDLIRFDGPDEGLLTHGARAILTYAALEDAVRRFSRLEIPLGWFEDTEGSLSDPEGFLTKWEKSRMTRNSGYMPRGLKYVPNTAQPASMQLTEARGFQASEVARLMNLPAVYVNAPTGDSLTYATTESNRRELVDLTLSTYTAAISQRLSMPDVTPAGTTVTVDLAAFLRGDIRQVLEAGEIAIRSGQFTVDEIRDRWHDLPPIGDQGTTTPPEDTAP